MNMEEQERIKAEWEKWTKNHSDEYLEIAFHCIYKELRERVGNNRFYEKWGYYP